MPITTAKNWRSQTIKTIELELPSGLTVLVRRPPVYLWIASGRVPENLVQAMLSQSTTPNLQPTATPEQFRQMFKFMRETILATVISPKITETPSSDDEISPDDVPLEDAQFIFKWAMSGAETPEAQKKSDESGVMQIDVSDLRQFRTF